MISYKAPTSIRLWLDFSSETFQAKRVGWYIQTPEWKYNQPKMLYPAQLSFEMKVR